MSNQLAIAAVTATLRSLLQHGVGIQEVTARPLDNARVVATGHQLNLFLYQVMPDAALRNQDMPRLTKPGETGYPALPLMLYYLLTAYSDDTDDTAGHMLLGAAMGVLHDHPLLGAKEIRDATNHGDLVPSDLHEQIERVRITLQPMTFEEMSKLWTTFQTHYRVSAAYQVSVVLIESKRPPRTPLPVLKRGEDDRGVTSQPDTAVPFPALSSLELPKRRMNAQPGDVIRLKGSRLAGGTVRIRSMRIPSPPQPVTTPVSDAQLDVTLPNTLAAGFYTVSVELTTPHGTVSSNELSLAVAPVITTVLPLTVARTSNNTIATINLTSSVNVLAEQRVSLLLGDFEAHRTASQNPTNAFQFVITKPAVGDFPTPIGVALLTRLRVDGVDSEILAPLGQNQPENTPLEFDPTKKITIT